MSSSCRAAVSIAALLGELLCVAAAPVAAQTWQIDYDPSLGTKPSAQGWTHDVADPLPDDELSEGNYLVALGALSQGDTGGSNTDAGNTQWYEAAPPSFDFQADLIVVDLRLKILASTLTAPGQPTPSAGFGVFVRDDSSQSVSLFVGAAGLFLQGMVGAGGSSLLVPFDSTLAYADYQLRVDRYGASVLVDGTVLATLASEDLHTGFLPRVVYLGDVSTTELSSSQLQSLRLALCPARRAGPQLRDDYGVQHDRQHERQEPNRQLPAGQEGTRWRRGDDRRGRQRWAPGQSPERRVAGHELVRLGTRAGRHE